MSRDRLIDAFLGATPWSAARRDALHADASFRRYVRLSTSQSQAMLMDAPPPQEDVRPWLSIARHLRRLGFSTPEIIAADESAGLLVIEDFGNDTFNRLIRNGTPEEPLYALAIDLLVSLHRHAGATAIDVPSYDDDRFVDEALLLTDWYLPAVHGMPITDDRRATYIEAWRSVLPSARQVPTTLVLRDYHVDNLMLLRDRDGIAACGLLDFQDALIGPISYDIVSLLEDARRDVDPAMAARLRDRYSREMPMVAREQLDLSCAILGAQRHAKVIGIFTRLSARDGKPIYLTHISRVWRLLERSLEHPALEPVKAWVDAFIPPADRRIPAVP